MIQKFQISNFKFQTIFKYLNIKIFWIVWVLVLGVWCLSTPLTVLAATGDFVALAPIPGLTDIQYAPNGLAAFFNNLYKFAIGAAAILAVIMIIWGGLEISTQDSVSKQGEGRKKIENAILGLVLVLSPVLVFTIINPSILNLSLNLPPINLTPGAGGSGGGGGTGPGPTDPTSGCTITPGSTSGILQIAICPSIEAAQKWSSGCNSAQNELSSIIADSSTNPANGIKSTSYLVTCTSKQYYIFIDPKSWNTMEINLLRPVVSTTNDPKDPKDPRTTDRPNNGSDAMNFKKICQDANPKMQTCFSSTEYLTEFDVPCKITGPNAATPWKCYKKKVSCVYSNVLDTLSSFCSRSPNWILFQ